MNPTTSGYLADDDQNQDKDQDEKLKSLAPRLRTLARHSKLLTDGAKVLFDELTDLSFLNMVSPRRGVVRISKKALAEDLGVSDRTITRHAHELEEARFIWTRTTWMGGMEITVWYIRQMADEKAEHYFRADPSFGSRQGKRVRQTLRGNNGRFLPPTAPSGQNCQPDGGTVEKAELQGLSPGHGQDCPRTGDSPVPGQGTPVSPDEGQESPSSTVRIVRGQGTAVSVVGGQDCPQSGDSGVPLQGTKLSEFKETPVGDRSLGVLKGGGKPPRTKVEPAVLDEWSEWMREVKREFRRERMERLGLLKKDVAKLKANPKNWKIALVPAAAKAIADREAVIAELRGKKPVPEKRIAELQVQIEEVRQNGASGTPTALLPGPAATLANLTRKISTLEGLLR